jgi:thiol-disulfide isomerase/thioredoxin
MVIRFTPAAVLLAVSLATLAPCGSAQVAPGAAFPSLSNSSLSGALPATAGKVVLVDFWASWCAPCKASFPAYSRLQQDYSDKGLVIIAVSVDDSARSYSSFVAKLKPGFATVHDAAHRLVAEVQVPTMPTSYLVDRSGKVRYVHAGFHGDATIKELRSEIDAILGEGKSP